jgi:hypothetical protein
VSKQETLQQMKSERSDQIPFQAEVPQELPFRVHYLDYINLINNVDRLYHRADTREKLVIGGGVFAFEERWRAKQRQSLCPSRWNAER